MRRILLLLLLAGCNFKPHYDRPEMNLGETWRFNPDDNSAYANVAWWEQFQDPVLDDLIQKALNNNQDLQVATYRVLEFYERYRVVFSQLFPQLSAGFDVDRIKLSEDIDFSPLVPGVPRINNLYHLFLNMSYEVDFWGRIRNATEAAKAEYLSFVEAQRTVILTLVSSVAAAYVQLRQNERQLDISILTYQSRVHSWDIAILRYEGGLVSEMEVKQAESEALTAKVQIKNFEVAIALQEDLISVLLGEAPGSVPHGALLTELKLPPSIPAGLPSDLLENRPDILGAEQKILAANAQVGVARAAFFPTINLTGLLGQRSTSTEDFLKSSASSFDFGMKSLQPLFKGGQLIAQSREAVAVLQEAIHFYQQTILTALQEVDDALIAHQKAKEKLAIQTEQVAALEQYRKLAQLRYDNGQNDYLTVLNAENSLFLSQLSMAKTEGDVFLSLISLYKALGQGWNVEKSKDAPL